VVANRNPAAVWRVHTFQTFGIYMAERVVLMAERTAGSPKRKGGLTFETFVAESRPRLDRAFIGCRGYGPHEDATSEALAYAFDNWERVSAMQYPVAYLLRVGLTRTAAAKAPPLPIPEPDEMPTWFEPGLVPCLRRLPVQQRTAVWLVHGCRWTYREVADAMGISRSAVGTHVGRALSSLRAGLEGLK